MNGKENNRVELAALQEKVRVTRRKCHEDMSTKYRKLFLFMDILLALSIIMNFGAVVITNVLVMEEQPDRVFHEVNPIQAELNDYEVHEESSSILMAVAIQFGMWALWVLGYVFFRRTVHTEWQLTIMLTVVIIYFSLLGWDFWNDFGYLLGVWIYG